MLRKGIYLSLLTAVISGFSIFANQFFVTQSDPLAFTTVRNILVALGLTLVMFLSGKQKRLIRLSRAEWIKLGIIGFIGGGIPFGLFFMGLAQTGAVSGNLIHKTLFIWVAMMAIPLLGERINKWQIAGYLSIIVATFFIEPRLELTINSGTMLVLIATVLWAVENVIAKIVLRTIPAEIIGWARIMIGVPFLLIMTLALGKGHLLFSPDTLAWGKLTTSAAFLVAYVLVWYKALSFAPATLVSSVLAFAPVVTTLLTGLFSGGQITSIQTGIIVAITIGVSLIITKLDKQKQPLWT